MSKKLRNQFEMAVQLSPSSVDARTDLAEFYLEAPGIVGGGQDKARAQAATLARLDPAKAHWVNARIAEKKKDFTNAEREYRAASEVSHGDANAWLNLALWYKHTGQFDQMEGAMNRAASAQVNHPVVLVDDAEPLIRTRRKFPSAIQFL